MNLTKHLKGRFSLIKCFLFAKSILFNQVFSSQFANAKFKRSTCECQVQTERIVLRKYYSRTFSTFGVDTISCKLMLVWFLSREAEKKTHTHYFHMSELFIRRFFCFLFFCSGFQFFFFSVFFCFVVVANDAWWADIISMDNNNSQDYVLSQLWWFLSAPSN